MSSRMLTKAVLVAYGRGVDTHRRDTAISAFRESLLWGLGVLFLPIVPLIFLIVHWHRAKGPFFIQLYGLGFVLLAVFALAARLPWHGHM